MTNLFRNVFDGLKTAGANFDVIAMSYYPRWDRCDYKDNINALGGRVLKFPIRF